MINKAIAHEKLSRILGRDTYQEACQQQCRNAYLHGLVDQRLEERKISLSQYYEAKVCILALGDDIFANEFENRFNKAIPPNEHLFHNQ